MENQTNPAIASLLPTLQDPNVRSFLDMISAAEGTTQHGYNTLFGGGKFDDLRDHPRQLFDFTETTGRPNKTSAAGRYQFLSNTWDEQAKNLGLPDFSPQSQDLAAVNLLKQRGILPDVMQGNWQAAVQKAGPIWASLPSSPYPQPRQSQDFVMSKLNTRLASGGATSDVNPVSVDQRDNPFANLIEEFRINVPAATGGNAAPQQPSPFDSLLEEFAIKPTQSTYTPPEQKPTEWKDVAYGAAVNFPKSGAKYIGDLVSAATSPIETIKNVAQVGGGAVINQLPKAAQDWLMSVASDPEKMQQSVQMAQMVGGEYAKKYGTLEGFKQAIATDPVSVLGDLSLLLTGGGAVTAKIPGLSKTGAAVSQVGRTIDPFNVVTKAVTKPLQLAEALATPSLGLSTGAGAESIREAAKAGQAGGSKAQAFLDNLRGNAPVEKVVDTAKDAVAELYRNRSNEYLAGMSKTTANPAILDFAPIDQAIAKAESIGTFNGIPIRENAAGTLQKIKQKVEQFRAGDPATFRTVEGFDKLKQAISDIQQSEPYGTPARKVADELYNAVKNEIVKQAPDYAKVMDDYENASTLLKDIQGTLSLNKNANVDTSVRKLQSILRNNANTNYGRRVELGRELEATGVPGADTLFPQLAGQMLSSGTPRGIQGGILPSAAGGAALFAGATNPATLAAVLGGAAASSPRLVGELAYYGGKTVGGTQKLAEALQKYTGLNNIDPYTLRMLATKLGQEPTEEQR